MQGLYIHIPFCRRKCFYCDFFSQEYGESISLRYIEALAVELRRHKNKKIDTVYIGGGTPSVLSSKQILRLLEAVNDNFDAASFKEFTFELNPESVSPEKLTILKEYGVSRLSMGLQSCDDGMLKYLGRIHDFGTFTSAYDAVRKAGFDNFNLDLIYGLPGQTAAQWKKDLEKALNFKSEHISLYPLSIEEGSVFFKNGINVSGDMQRDMYEAAVNILEAGGFNHYEISNWAKSGRQSLHNGNYWRNFEYIGAGAGASGYENRIRYTNVEDIETYAQYAEKGIAVNSENYFIDDKTYESETIILGLRLLDEGVDINKFTVPSYKNTLDKLISENMLINENGRIKLHKNAVFVSNMILSEFISCK